MGKHNVDNPLYDMGNAVVELYKVADMAGIIIEAIFNGDSVTLQAVGIALMCSSLSSVSALSWLKC